MVQSLKMWYAQIRATVFNAPGNPDIPETCKYPVECTSPKKVLLQTSGCLEAKRLREMKSKGSSLRNDRRLWSCFVILCVCLVLCTGMYYRYVIQHEKRIEGTLPAEPSFLIYLGGFCFGRSRVGPDPFVGMINFELRSDGKDSATFDGELYVVMFDDEDTHWKQAANKFTVSQWRSVLHAASSCQQIHPRFPGSVVIDDFQYGIKEKFGRHWHVALLGLNFKTSTLESSLRYHLSSVAELSRWTNRSDASQRCPGQPVELLKETLADYLDDSSSGDGESGPNRWESLGVTDSPNDTWTPKSRRNLTLGDPRLRCATNSHHFIGKEHYFYKKASSGSFRFLG
jgi:hypothetical protein